MNLQPPSPRFLARPRPVPGESATGYLMRVASANGFTSIGRLYSGLTLSDKTPFLTLTERLDLSEAERQYLVGELPARWCADTDSLGLDRSDFNHSHRRWCSKCIVSSGHLRGLWGFKLSCVCPVHGTWLADRCVQCGQLPTWHGVSCLQCQCGAALQQTDAECDARDVLELSRCLVGVRSATHPFPWAEGMSLRDLHHLVRHLGSISPGVSPRRPGRTANLHALSTASDLVRRAATLLWNWPTGFYDLLHSLQANSLGQLSVQREFWPLYGVIYRELRDPAFYFLRQAFEDYLRENWWGTVCLRNRRLQSATRLQHPRRTVAQAAEATAIPPSTVRHLIQAALIPSTSVQLPSGRTARTLHTDALAMAQDLTVGAHTLREAATALHLPKRRIRQLLAANILTALLQRVERGGPAMWLISQTEVNRLWLPSGKTGVTLHHVLRFWRLSDSEVMDLIRAVLEEHGAFGLGAEHAERQPLGLVRFESAVIRGWLNAHRKSLPGPKTVDQVAQALGLKQQVVYELVRKGHLRTSGQRGQLISPEDLATFSESYVSLASYARQVGRSPRSLLLQIKAAPICGPTVDGSRQYFFRRCDLPDLGTTT